MDSISDVWFVVITKEVGRCGKDVPDLSDRLLFLNSRMLERRSPFSPSEPMPKSGVRP